MLGIIGLGGKCYYEQSVRRIIPSQYYAVAADSGIAHFKALGIVPDLLVGDLDSISDVLLDQSKKENIIIHQYNPKKNCTDSEIAVDKALKHGCESLLFLGAFGNRLDHMLSNQMMAASLSEKGIQVIMTDGVTFIYTVTKENSPFKYPLDTLHANEDVFSIIPIIGDSVGITLEGLEYPLKSETILFGSTWGVSNTVNEPHNNEKLEIINDHISGVSNTVNEPHNNEELEIINDPISGVSNTVNENINGGQISEYATLSVNSGVVFFIHTKSDAFLFE